MLVNTWNVEVVAVKGSTGLLNCNCTTLLVGKPVDEFAGLTLTTEGVVPSLVVPVIMEKLPGFESPSPPTSVTADVVTIVYVVFAASPPRGVKVTRWLPFERAIAPGIDWPPV